ncbi:oligosaccharide flippase family protein [Natrarchaeobius chitinivorans]|uniref:Polysaccharide biosynthesis protein n=1 Tax=Natrarchaeobius chitinivorans TaxID=1679083 RepID=A0A3N6MBY9_NATCH|nr:polysaccharide biosynthesis C-terminal domain-containing protein [Natrarchaeobius chitinivorans]RQG94020.1 polysaccharide biosynthesis protein [Natrarchaeobius chitinivorans]
MSPDATDTTATREVVSSSIAKVVKIAIAFAGSILFARLLGPAGYGSFYLILSITEILDRLIKGWGEAGKKRISEVTGEADQITGAMILSWIVLVPIVFGLTYGFRTPLDGFLEVENGWLYVALSFAMISAFILFEGLTEGFGRVGTASWASTLQEWAAFPFQIGLILLGFGVAGLVYGYAAGIVIALPMLLYYGYTTPALPRLETIRSLWEYGRFSIANKLLGRTYARIDILLLGLLVTPAAAGHYEIAYRIGLTATIVSSSAALFLMARVSTLRSKGEEYAQEVTGILSYASILSIPLFFGSLLVAEDVIVLVYGEEFAPAGVLLIGLALYRIVVSQSQPLIEYVNGIDRPDVNMRISAATLGLNVVLGVTLILALGPIGVVISTITSELLRYLSLVYYAKTYFGLETFITREFRRQFVAGVIMLAVVYPVTRVHLVGHTVDTVLAVTTGVVAYTGALLALSEPTRRAVFERVPV